MRDSSIIRRYSRPLGLVGLLAIVIGGCDGSQTELGSGNQDNGTFSAEKVGENTYQVQGSGDQIKELVESLQGQGATVDEKNAGVGFSELTVASMPAAPQGSATGEEVEDALSSEAGFFKKEPYCVRYFMGGQYCYTQGSFYTNTGAFTWWTSFYCFPWMTPSSLRKGTCSSNYPGLPK